MVETKFKKTDIGIIPEDWEVDKLGEFSFITKLAGFEYSKYFNSYKDGGDIIVVRGTNITHNRLDLTDVKFIPQKTSDFLQRSKLSKGDLVFAYVGTIGPIYKIEDNNRFHLGPNTAKIRIEKDNVSTSYIYNYFLSEFIRKEIEDRISVGAQPSLSMSKIRDFSIPLPPLPEQKAIAEVLSDTDHWITSLDGLIAKKQLIKQGAMQKLLTPKEDWEVKRLGDLTKVFTKQTGFDYSAYIKPSLVQTKSENDIPFIQNKDFNNKWINLNTDYYIPKNIAQNFPRILLNEKSLLISISGAIGNIGVYERNELAFIGGAIAILKFKNPEIIDWAMYYLKSREGQLKLFGNVKAGSHQNLILDDIRKIEIPLPKIQEQIHIASILSDMDAEIETLEQKLAKAKQVKQGLMQKLLTGRIRLV